MKKIFKSKRAFTLAELLIVIAIIAILAAIAIPVYSNVMEKSKQTKDRANVEMLMRCFKYGSLEYGTDKDGGMYFIGNGGCTYPQNGELGSINKSILDRVAAVFGESGRMSKTGYYQLPPLTSEHFKGGVVFKFVLVDADGKMTAAEKNNGLPFTVIYTKHPDPDMVTKLT